LTLRILYTLCPRRKLYTLAIVVDIATLLGGSGTETEEHVWPRLSVCPSNFLARDWKSEIVLRRAEGGGRRAKGGARKQAVLRVGNRRRVVRGITDRCHSSE
jgi:hypothetical protein